MASRSPIRLRKDEFISKFLHEAHFQWECDEDELQGAHFVERKDPQRFAVLHRTTKAEYRDEYPWQVSFFDELGAVGDSVARTCQKALRDHISNRVYKLVDVLSREQLAALPRAEETRPPAEHAALRSNPARRRRFTPSHVQISDEALAKYREFQRLEPRKVGQFAKSFAIPKQCERLGEAKTILYRSSKVDPETLRAPRRPVDYIHEHEGGVACYKPAKDGIVEVPDWLADEEGLVLLGECLGFEYTDDDTGELVEVGVKHPLPELYTIASGRALLVVQSKEKVLRMMWGGALGVEARGIVG